MSARSLYFNKGRHVCLEPLVTVFEEGEVVALRLAVRPCDCLCRLLALLPTYKFHSLAVVVRVLALVAVFALQIFLQNMQGDGDTAGGNAYVVGDLLAALPFLVKAKDEE